MAQICDSIIAQGIGTSSEDMVQRGLEADGIIINRKDIDFSATTFDESVNNIVKTLVLKTGKQGYPVSQLGATPFTGTNTSLTKGTYINKFNNTEWSTKYTSYSRRKIIYKEIFLEFS